MNIKLKWSNLKIRQKLLALFLPLNIVILLMILLVSIVIVSKTQKEDINENARTQLRLISTQVDEIISNVEYNIKSFSTSSALQDAILTDYPSTEYGDYLFSSSLHNSIYNIMDINNYINQGYIHTYKEQIYDVKNDKLSSPTKEQDYRYQQIVEQHGRILMSQPRLNDGDSVFNISKSIIDIKTGRNLGVFSFDIKESVIHKAYSEIDLRQSGELYIIDNQDEIISSTNRDLLNKPVSKILGDFSFEKNKNKENQIIHENQGVFLITYSSDSALIYIYKLNYYSLYNKMILLIIVLLFTGFFAILLTILLSQKFAKNLTRPLIELEQYAIKLTKGNFQGKISSDSSDEIGSLTRQFQEMSESIKDLTAKIFNEQNTKREYELNLLQAQINPHFLYNSLDNINALIEDNDKTKAISMITHLASYYRLILSKGRNVISIKEELNLIKNYLEIQLIKNPDLFSYKFEVSNDLLDLPILKMLLQPIVENSVIHGFTGYKTNLLLNISGHLEKGCAILIVSDNGRGMSIDQKENIYSASAISVPRSFGFRSVDERIRIKYGNMYGATIDSTIEYGTTVTIKYPI